MKCTHMLGLIAVIIWAVVVLMGLGGIDSIRSQHVPGFPSAGQVRYYVFIPAGVLALVIVAWAIAAYRRQFRALATILISLALLALPGYLFFYTGGV